MPELRNAKHERFAALVAQGEQVSDAYVRAGYADTHAGRTVNAYVLHRRPMIQARIGELRSQGLALTRRRFRTEFEDLLLHADAIARSDIADAWPWIAEGGDLRRLPESIRWAIKAVEVTRTRRSVGDEIVEEREHRRLVLHDKLGGLELLGKELGGFMKAQGEGERPEAPLHYAELTPEQVAAAIAPRFVSAVLLPAGGDREGGGD